MEIKLLSGNYKNDENFYQAFLNDTLWQSEYLSNESKLIPRKLSDFPIYLNRFDSTSYENDYLEMLHAMTAYVLDIDRDITMDECFWHSWLCLYQREYLLEKYPKIKEKYSNFKNIVIKKFDWENYIYKGLLIAQYVQDNVAPQARERYYRLILNNFDMFNYIIKYEIFRNGQFLINIMDVIDETGLSAVLKAKIKNRPDLGKDERYGRRVLFEMNKAYPVVMSPMLDKESLKGYFLEYLSYYYDGSGDVENVAEEEEVYD